MIDLTRFSDQQNEAILPIINGWGKLEGRKIWKTKREDGWYLVHLGTQPQVIRKATPVEISKTLKEKKSLKVFAFGREGIPINFNNFFKRGFGETVLVNFLNLPLFEVAKIVLWEDNRFYFYEADSKFQFSLLQSIKKCFAENGALSSLAGITPEIFYYWTLANLESQAYRQVDELLKLNLSEEEKKKRVQQFQNTMEDRVKHVIIQAGGEFVKLYKANADSYMLHWKVKGSSALVKSTIKDDLRIMSAGFCLNDDDKSHTVSSIVQLAKMFESRAPLYITRE